MYQSWHWLSYNFQQGRHTAFSLQTLHALEQCDNAMPGYADEMLGRLERMGGRVSARNREGGGFEVDVALPMA